MKLRHKESQKRMHFTYIHSDDWVAYTDFNSMHVSDEQSWTWNDKTSNFKVDTIVLELSITSHNRYEQLEFGNFHFCLFTSRTSCPCWPQAEIQGSFLTLEIAVVKTNSPHGPFRNNSGAFNHMQSSHNMVVINNLRFLDEISYNKPLK